MAIAGSAGPPIRPRTANTRGGWAMWRSAGGYASSLQATSVAPAAASFSVSARAGTEALPTDGTTAGGTSEAASAPAGASSTARGVPKRSTSAKARRGSSSGTSASASHASAASSRGTACVRTAMRKRSGYYTCRAVANHLACLHDRAVRVARTLTDRRRAQERASRGTSCRRRTCRRRSSSSRARCRSPAGRSRDRDSRRACGRAPRPSPSSPPPVHGRAALAERPPRLDEVLRAEADRLSLRRELEAPLLVGEGVDGQLGVPEGERRLCGDRLCERADGRLELRVLDHAVHEADAERLLGVDAGRGEDELLRPGRPHQAWQPRGAAQVGQEPVAELERTELRRARRDAEVARERELEPGAERVAAQRGDAREGGIHEPAERLLALADHRDQAIRACPGLHLRRRPEAVLARDLRQVDARGEGAALAGDDQAAEIAFVAQRPTQLAQLGPHLRRLRVQLAGPVEPQTPDGSLP